MVILQRAGFVKPGTSWLRCPLNLAGCGNKPREDHCDLQGTKKEEQSSLDALRA